MGTGNKVDASKLEIVDIRKTNYDPLARILRKVVKDELENEKVMVVSSTEKPASVNKKIGSVSFVPGTAGLLIASYIVNDVIKK